MGSSTVLEIRLLTARLLGDCVTGEATGGTNSTLIDTTWRNEDDDYWSGAYVYISPNSLPGGFRNFDRRVTDFVQSTSVLTLEAACTATIIAGDDYELHFLFPAHQYHEFVVMALRSLSHRGVLLKAVVDESLTWITDQYDYSVPANMTAIRRIDKQTTTGAPGSDDFEPLSGEQWEIRRSTTRKIVFGKNFSQLANGQQLRIHGYQEFADPTTDTDTYTVDPFVVAYLAASMAAGALIANEPTAHWREMEQRLSDMATKYEARERAIFDSQLRWVDEN